MGLFSFNVKRRRIGRLCDLPQGSGVEVLLSALPSLTQHLVGIAQKSAIAFYRKIHSHEAGGFVEVREEFLFLFLHIFKRRLLSLSAEESAPVVLGVCHEALDRCLSEVDKNFDREKFRTVFREREDAYRRLEEPVSDEGLTKVDGDVLRVFSTHLCRPLKCLPDHKVTHFCAQILKDAVRQL